MLRKTTNAFGLIAAVFALILVSGETRNANAQLNLVDYAYPVSGWVNTYGPESGQNDWVVRKALGDFIDFVTDTVDFESHPLLHPDLGPFISKFHSARWWEAIDTLHNKPLPATGVRAVKLYSSSWIVQTQDGNGRFTFGVDVCDGPFHQTVYTPNNVPVSNSQFAAMANILDAYFISHIHGDHLSNQLVYEMLLRGKPVIATQEIKNDAIYLGAPNAHSIIVPTTNMTQNIGPLTWTAFSGWQYMSWLDAAQTIPDTNHPMNVTCNAFLFSLAGKDIIHFGDNNDSGIVSWLQSKLNQGWDIDLQFNMGHYYTALAPMISPEARFLTHELEFHHFGDSFLSLLVDQNGPNSGRRVLMWGEHYDCP